MLSQPTKISSVSEFTSSIKDKIQSLFGPDEHLNIWFRGEPITESNLTPLIPKGYRMYNDPIIEAFTNTKALEGNLRAEFERQSLPYFFSKGIPANKWNIYFMMVHYGLRTRLLDWTQSALTALYFSIEDLSIKEDSKIWLLNPHRLNKYTTSKLHNNNSGFSAILIPRETKEQDLFVEGHKINPEELSRIYLDLDFNKTNEDTEFYPLAILPTFLDERMSMQQSCFTIFGNVVDGFFEIDEDIRKSFLDFILIDKTEKRKLKEELQWLGITQRSIYPDLEGISKSIDYKYNNDHVLKRIK
jgi:hypothetical protein